jgi:hypothetical protein
VVEDQSEARSQRTREARVNRRGFLRALIGVTMAPLLPTLPAGYSLGAGGLIVPDRGSLLATIEGDETMLQLIRFRGHGLVEVLAGTGSSMLQVFADGGELFYDFAGFYPIATREVPLIVKAPAGSSLQIAYQQAGQVWTKSWTTA